MDIAQMRMIVTLSECQSMTVTAKKVHLTQPALTYQLNNIESELGFKVFERTHAGTKLTREGGLFCDRLRGFLHEYDESVRLARTMAQNASPHQVRVAVTSRSRDALSLLIRTCKGAFGDTDFALIPCENDDVVPLMRTGLIDLWSCSDIVMDGQQPDDLRFQKLFETHEVLHMKADHRLAAKETITIDDLRGETVWLWPKGDVSSTSDVIRDYIDSHHLDIDVVDYLEDIPTMLSVLTGKTVALVDAESISPLPDGIVARPLTCESRDIVGVAYLDADGERLAPVIEQLEALFARYEPESPSGPLAQVGRIISIVDDISSTVRRGGRKDVVPLVNYALDLGLSAQEILEQGLMAGMYSMDDDFKAEKASTPDMLAAVDTMNTGVAALKPLLDSEKVSRRLGDAVIGTVKGDVHDIGKNLVRMMLESKGIRVTDLGSDVAPERFVEYVKANPACNLVLLSVFLTSAVPNAGATIRAIADAGLRDQVFVMVGGQAMDATIAREVGADIYTDDALSAASKAVDLLSC